jgi:hypothetical protein
MSKQHLIPAKAKLQWAKLKLANKFTNILDEDQEKRIKAMQEKAIAEIEANGIRLTHTESTQDNLKLQGDAEMLSKENMLRRNNLKRHPRVMAVIRRFWDVIDMMKDGDGNLTQVPYVEMNIRLSKSLVPNDDIKEVRASAAVDWLQDVSGHETMDHSCFFMGLFELADMWVEDIDGDEYAEFLEKLFMGVAFTDAEGDHWRDVDDIVCQIHEDDDLEDDDLELLDDDDLGLGNELKTASSFKFNSNKGWGSKKELKGDKWHQGRVGDDEANISLLGQGENEKEGGDGNWKKYGKGDQRQDGGDGLGSGEGEKEARESGWNNKGAAGTDAALSTLGGGAGDDGRRAGGWSNSGAGAKSDEYGGLGSGEGKGKGKDCNNGWDDDTSGRLLGRQESGLGEGGVEGGGGGGKWNGNTTSKRGPEEGTILSPNKGEHKQQAESGGKRWSAERRVDDEEYEKVRCCLAR